MKVALIVVAKNEEQHLIEFIEYYKNLGIDNIFFGDNNDEGKTQYDLLKSYIDNGYVKYYNYHNIKNIQHIFYDDIYFKEKDNYDWFVVFDCDEFLNIGEFGDIKNYINNRVNNNDYFDLIQIRWKCAKYKEIKYHNQNKTYKDDEENLEFYYRTIIKFIFKSSDKIIRINGHYPIYKDNLNIYSLVEGYGIILFCEKCDLKKLHFNISDIFLKHYQFMSLDEYVNKKCNGRAARTKTFLESMTTQELIDIYFKYTNYKDNDNKAHEYLVNEFNKYK